MVEQRENYVIRSNRESGFGRYDIMLIPRPQRKGSLPAVVLEFKVYNEKKEKNLEDTVKAAFAADRGKAIRCGAYRSWL